MYTTNFNQFALHGLDNDRKWADFKKEVKRITGMDCIGIDRENFMWGFSPRLCFSNNITLYAYNGKLYEPAEFMDYLRENWRPVNRVEVDYFCQYLGHENLKH